MGEAQQEFFESEIEEPDSKFGSWYQLPLLAYSVGLIKVAVEILKQCKEPQKITASLKQNLETDG